MRIGIDATSLPPQPVGAGNYIIHLIRSFSSLQLEHELVVFAHQSGHDLLDIPDKRALHWVVVSDKSPAQRLLWEQIALPVLVRRAGIDLLHSLHYTRPVALPCASVVTFHDMTFFLYPQLHTRSKRFFFPIAIRMSARKADALIAISESTRQDTIRLLGVLPQKIISTPLGVTEDFRPVSDSMIREEVRQKYKLPEDYILYVGLVEPRKNLPLLIKSFKALVERGVHHQLVIVGRFGWMYKEVLQQIEALGVKEKVQFTGYVPSQDLPMVYNLASVFVYPTLYEGFGLPALEAMACGTPVITSAISSLPEIVGDAGLLVPPGDEQALSDAIFETLSNQTLQKQLATKGIQRASLFTWERTAQETLRVYESVLKTPLQM